MATSISFNGYSLQSSTVTTAELQHENVVQKRLNIQKFAEREGGRMIRPDFDVKLITLAGTIRGTSKSDLEQNIDTLKKELNAQKKHLDIAYSTGTRRYEATCSRFTVERKHFTIDAIDWEAEFTVTDPPFGFSIDTSTLELLGQTGSSPATTTMTISGFTDYAGTFRPHPTIVITFTACTGIRTVDFVNTNGDGLVSATTVTGYKFYNGDVLMINTKEGTVQVNGVDVDFTNGLPAFTLTDNSYDLKIIGQSYNVDVKFIYYSLWI